MVLIKFVLLLTLALFGVLGADDKEEMPEETEIREGKQFRPETWRAVDNERLDMSGWIPQGSPPDQRPQPLLKRRRLRKRKRRPTQPNVNDDKPAEMQDRILYLPGRRQQPSIFDEVWDMEQESPKQAVSRRRVAPSYETGNAVNSDVEPEIITQKPSDPLSAVIRFGEPVEETTKPRTTERIRDPFDALKEAEEKQKTPEEIRQTSAPPDLKSLLKKTGGTISLSEILQQKNLSLSELLTGNVDAISALTTPPESTETTKVMELNEQTKYQRIPPSERKKLTDRFSVKSDDSEEIERQEILEAQRKRLALLQAHKENKVYLGITHTYEIVTEPVTERRIFVPSHPKHYSTTSYMPLLFQNSFKTTTSKTQTYTDRKESQKAGLSNTNKPLKFSHKKLPITSAKLLTKTTKKTPMTENKPVVIPPKAIPINIDEILKKEPLEQTKDEPLQISLNSDLSTKLEESPEDSSEKLETLRGGEEIMEMLEDPIYKDKLSRILRERNMTLQELVDQRERGSSQLHLADIFHNKTREPEPIDEPYVGMIIKNEPPHYTREQKSMKFEEQTSTTEDVISEVIIEQSSVEENIIPSSTEKKTPQIDVFPKNTSFNYAAIMPFWKQFHPNLFNNLYKDDEPSNSVERLEEIDNKLSDAVNHQFNVDLTQRNYHLDEESIFDIPNGIKSALIASFAIVALSLFMFLTILLIFKWTQRKKNKLNYMSSLSGIKIKSPILEVPRRSALRTFVCETLGRKTKFYKSNLQSMSDSWDDKKQKF
ncbi:uncharacterized protein LOC123309373 [Coccinella septempunctata]|uniref:uncharacterized protein LOC123309373 n=1 Tax=Coccinella septempunctata TaxID=41139 RepID=UPI001D06E840|nr:uncharacterized protein LOC123309373 [Coccinella septempunctata]